MRGYCDNSYIAFFTANTFEHVSGLIDSLPSYSAKTIAGVYPSKRKKLYYIRTKFWKYYWAIEGKVYSWPLTRRIKDSTSDGLFSSGLLPEGTASSKSGLYSMKLCNIHEADGVMSWAH